MKVCKLSDICELKYGKNLPVKERALGIIPVYGSNGVVGMHNDTFTTGKTIIIGRKGSIGKIHVSHDSCWPIDTTYYIDSTCTECDIDWLALYLHFLDLGQLNKASGVPGLNRDDAYAQLIRVPKTKTEQQQVAIKIQTQLAEVKKTQKAAESQLKDLALLRKRKNEKIESLLKDVQRVPLDNLLIGIEAGKSLKTSEQLARDNEFGILKVSAVSWSEFQPTEAKRFENDSYQPPEHHKVKKGDLIISRANTLELVGAAVYVDEDYPFRLLSDKTLRLVLQEDKILPEFLLCILRLSEARDHIESNATGSSDSMRNISQKTIRSIPVPLPDKDVQLKIIQLVKASRKLIGTAEQSAKQIIADTKLMPTKLLTQTFNH